MQFYRFSLDSSMIVTILPGHGIKIQCGGENAAFHSTHCRSGEREGGGRILLLTESGVKRRHCQHCYIITRALASLCGAVTKTGIEMFSFYGNLAASLALVTL